MLRVNTTSVWPIATIARIETESRIWRMLLTLVKRGWLIVTPTMIAISAATRPASRMRPRIVTSCVPLVILEPPPRPDRLPQT